MYSIYIYTLYTVYISNEYIQWIYPHHPRCFPAEAAPAVGQFLLLDGGGIRKAPSEGPLAAIRKGS